jgi:hypothetical protein
MWYSTRSPVTLAEILYVEATMTTQIQELQAQFSETISEHTTLDNMRRDCRERGDVIGYQQCEDEMIKLGILAVGIQSEIAARGSNS